MALWKIRCIFISALLAGDLLLSCLPDAVYNSFAIQGIEQIYYIIYIAAVILVLRRLGSQWLSFLHYVFAGFLFLLIGTDKLFYLYYGFDNYNLMPVSSFFEQFTLIVSGLLLISLIIRVIQIAIKFPEWIKNPDFRENAVENTAN